MPGVRKPTLKISVIRLNHAAEKSIKGVFISLHLDFPYTHDIRLLLTLLEESGVLIPEEIKQSERLTVYAVQTRYPGYSAPIKEKHYHEALSLAELVIAWAETFILAEHQHQ
jgi:HEPN domain-containing protein